MRRSFLFFLILLAGVSGCTLSPTPSPIILDKSTGAPVQVETSSAYPNIASTAYVAPSSSPDLPEPTWTPAPGTGSVTARLLLSNEPVVDVRMYLADIIQDKDGKDISASIDPANSPRAYTDENGSFTFINVPPGRYSLVLNNAIESYMIYKPGTQESIIIEVIADNQVALGDLNYTDLPIQR